MAAPTAALSPAPGRRAGHLTGLRTEETQGKSLSPEPESPPPGAARTLCLAARPAPRAMPSEKTFKQRRTFGGGRGGEGRGLAGPGGGEGRGPAGPGAEAGPGKTREGRRPGAGRRRGPGWRGFGGGPGARARVPGRGAGGRAESPFGPSGRGPVVCARASSASGPGGLLFFQRTQPREEARRGGWPRTPGRDRALEVAAPNASESSSGKCPPHVATSLGEWTPSRAAGQPCTSAAPWRRGAPGLLVAGAAACGLPGHDIPTLTPAVNKSVPSQFRLETQLRVTGVWWKLKPNTLSQYLRLRKNDKEVISGSRKKTAVARRPPWPSLCRARFWQLWKRGPLQGQRVPVPRGISLGI